MADSLEIHEYATHQEALEAVGLSGPLARRHRPPA